MLRVRRRALLSGLAVVGLLAILVDPAADDATSQSGPSVDSARINGAILELSLSEALSSGSAADAGDFSVKLGDDLRSVVSASVDGAVLRLTLASAVPDVDCTDASVKVGYSAAASSLVGVHGGALAAFADQRVENVTDDAPAIVSISTDTSGGTIVVEFCEAITDISFQWSDFSAFAVAVNGSMIEVNDLVRPAAAPATVELRLSNSQAIQEGDLITLAFDQDDASEDYPLQDLDQDNRLVESWVARSVTNNVDSPPALRSASARYDVVTLTFSEALDEQSVPDPGQFTIRGRTVTAVAISEDTVTLTLNGILPGDGTSYTLDYIEPSESPLRQLDAAHTVADIASFEVASSTPTTRPVVQAASVDGGTLTITFDLPLKNVAPAGAFTVSGQDGVSVTAVSFAAAVVTLSVAPAVTAGSTITVSYVKPGSPPRVEARNNLDANSFSHRAVVNNTVAPAPVLSGAGISADGAALTLAYSLALDASSAGTPEAATFSLSGSAASVDSVTVEGASVTLALTPPADTGETVTVSYGPPDDAAKPRLRSLAHSQAADGFMAASVTNNADGKPRPRRATVDGSQIAIRFDRSLDAASIPAATAFTLTGISATVGSAAISGSELTLTLSSSATHEQTISISYAAPADSPLKRDGRAILVDSFSALDVANETPDPTPRFRSAVVDETGRSLTITMSGPLLASAAGVPGTNAFSLTGSAAAMSEIAVEGSNVTLTLSPAADVGETLALSYAPPTGATDPALTSADGTWRAPSWSAQPVTNRADGVPRPLTAEVDGGTMTIAFDRALSASHIPATADFSVSPAATSVDAVAISAETLTLTLSPAVAHDDTATVSYSAAGTVKLMRAGRMIAVPAFSDLAVVNRTPEPLIRSVIGDRDAIVITFSQMLDTESTPIASSFSLGADRPTVDTVTVDTMSVGLELAESLIEGGEYALAYTPPSESPLRTAEGAVAAFSEPVTNRTDVAPALRSAVGDGALVTLTFDQPLDGGAAIPLMSFALSDGATAITSSVISGPTLTLTLSRPLAEDETIALTYTQPQNGGIIDPTGNRTLSFREDIDNQTDTAPAPASGTVVGDEIVIILDQAIFNDPRFSLDVQPDGYPSEHFTLTGTDADVSFVLVATDGPGGVGRIVITLSEAVTPDAAIAVTYFPDTGTVRIREDGGDQRRAEINGYRLQNLTPAGAQSATVHESTLIVTFDHALDSAALPQSSSFTLVVPGRTVTVASVAIGNGLLTLTLSESVIEDESVSLTYAASEDHPLLGVNGAAAQSFEMLTVENLTDTAPVVERVKTDMTGGKVFVTFDQRLNPPTNADTSWFAFDPPQNIDSLDDKTYVDGQPQLEITLSSLIREGADLRLTYDPGVSVGLTDDDGEMGNHNPVAVFTEDVVNVVDVAPQVEQVTVNGHALTIKFDQPLHDTLGDAPPASCEQLSEEDSQVDCQQHEDFTWFTVERVGADGVRTVTVSIETVTVADDTVVLQLVERIGKRDAVRVGYQPKSYSGGSRNLRDRSVPAHPVEGFTFPSDEFPGWEIENVTPATAEQTMLDRERPDELRVTFDSGLDPDSMVDAGAFSVTADGAVIDVHRVRVSGATLTVDLASEVPECASVVIEYEPGASPLLDSNQPEIEAFRFEVENLINAEWGLICAGSNFGGLVLTFNDTGIPDRPGREWRLAVNGEQREVEAVSAGSVVRLTTKDPVCRGDSVEVQYAGDDEGAVLDLARMIEQAAPCAVSAAADGVALRVNFDSPLDEVLPDAGEFEISGGAATTGIEGIEGMESMESMEGMEGMEGGGVLRLRLAAPGILGGRTAKLSYAGESLQGGGLTVGAFELEVVDRTAPPKFVSGFAFGSFVSLTFDQPLIPRTVPASRFLPLGGGVSAEVEAVSISGVTVSLILSDDLPDDPELIAVIYRAGSRGGLSGRTGIRVSDSVFVVRNLTETPPGVNSVVADSLTIRVGFDQQVNGDDALASDFSVVAGHRTIQVESLQWSAEELELTLAERVTSLDVVRLSYAAGQTGGVRDSSGLSLAPFDIRAENETEQAKTVVGKTDDALLRSRGGATTFERELAREFSSGHGIRAIVEGGNGRTTLVRGDMQLTLDASQLGDDAMRIELHPLTNARQMLGQLDSVPAICRDQDDAGGTVAWLLDLSDVDGIPALRRLRVSLDGSAAAELRSGCVLDLIAGAWSFTRLDGRVDGPALLIGRLDRTFIVPIGLPRAR